MEFVEVTTTVFAIMYDSLHSKLSIRHGVITTVVAFFLTQQMSLTVVLMNILELLSFEFSDSISLELFQAEY